MATETGTRGDARPQRRSTWASVRVWLTVTIVFCLLADLAVRLAEPHLAQPVAWPTPELQDKYDGVTKLAPGHHVRTVLFGDSMMDAGGDPALMHQVPGITYNASLAGETLGTIATWATNVVVPRLHPTTVVLGFNINALNPNIPGLANSQKTYKSSRVAEVAGGGGDIADHLDKFLRDHVALYEYRSVLRKVFQPRSGSDSTVYDPPLSSLGWNETFRSLHYNDGPGTTTVAQGLSETKGDLLFNFAVGSTEERQLGDLIERLHHEGARVVLAVMPVANDFTTAPHGGQAAYGAALIDLLDIGHSHGALVVSPGVWSNSYFASPAHLNAAGTLRFSTLLALDLARADR